MRLSSRQHIAVFQSKLFQTSPYEHYTKERNKFSTAMTAVITSQSRNKTHIPFPAHAPILSSPAFRAYVGWIGHSQVLIWSQINKPLRILSAIYVKFWIIGGGTTCRSDAGQELSGLVRKSNSHLILIHAACYLRLSTYINNRVA